MFFTKVINKIGTTHIRSGGQYIILLEIYSSVTVPNYIEIGWYSTKLLQKQKVCSFCDTVYL